MTAVRARVGLREDRHDADWIVLATGGFASGGLELTRAGRAREVALGLPVAGRAGGRAGSASARVLRRAADGARRRRGRRDQRPSTRPASGCSRTCSWPGATLAGASRGSEKSGDGLSLSTGLRAAELILGARARSARPAATARADRLAISRRRRRARRALMRESLDHCVKCTICETFCPVATVTPLFPGPKYVGPQAERFRVDDEPSPDASLDYCSGCGVCTQVCPQGVHIAEINTQARAELKRDDGFKLRDRLLARPTLAGRLGTPAAPVANFTLRNTLLRLAVEKVVGLHRARRAAEASPAGRSSAGQEAPLAAGVAARGVLPRLRRELLRAAHGRDDRRAARAHRARGRRAQAGLLRAAAAVQRPVRRRAQVRAPDGANGSRRPRARASTSSARRRAAR